MSSEEDGEKTVEELAREAIEAIKKAEQIEKLREEEERKASENALKQDVQNRIKSKMRRLEAEQEKEEKNKATEVDASFMVTWTNPDKKGLHYIGEYNESNVFKISRGITLFHLYITGKDVLHESWRKNAHTSMSLYRLKEKADKILKESNLKSEKQK